MSSLHLSLGFQSLGKPDNVNVPFLVHPSTEANFGTTLDRHGGIAHNGRPDHQYSCGDHATTGGENDIDGLNDLNFLADLNHNVGAGEEMGRNILPNHSSDPFHDGDFNSTMDLFRTEGEEDLRFREGQRNEVRRPFMCCLF